jgi:hypothetical protein
MRRLAESDHDQRIGNNVKLVFQRTLVIIGACAFLWYLLESRRSWFPELESQIDVGQDRKIKDIDVSHPETITWKISGDEWKYEGALRVALLLDDLPAVPRESYEKESMKLSITMDAYAITYEPAGKGSRVEGFRADRLIRNWYYTTDMPLSPKARIWESGGGAYREFSLAGVQRYPWEDTYIVAQIVQADPTLQQAHPRLQITGSYDYAVFEHIEQLRFVRDTVLFLLASCVIYLAYLALRRG